MDASYWLPRSTKPSGLVEPVRIDPSGTCGPTRGQTRGPRWRRSSHGWYVPSSAPDCVEQRILEQSVRIPGPGALTAWASLRWQGAAYFEGIDRVSTAALPVPVVLGGWADIGRDPAIDVSRERFWPHEIVRLDGVPCAVPERALFDEVRRHGVRAAVVAAEMAIAAELTTVARFAAYVAGCQGWTWVPHVRLVLPLLTGDSRSPQETRMRLVWELDAGLPRPLCNVPLFDLDDRLIGVPDLFDPVAGVVGEYDGADHTRRDRRRSDVAREHRLRGHRLEYFSLVSGDFRDQGLVVRRMHDARRRAHFLPASMRTWTLEQPAWWRSRQRS